MEKDAGNTEAGQQDATTHAAHHATEESNVALQLHRDVVSAHSNTQEVNRSQSQIQNIASVVPKHVLLVYPRFPITYWGFQYSLRLIGKRASLPPLGLITVAALLPNHWHLRLVDLNLEDLRDDDLQWADLVLTGGLLIQVKSMQEIITRARAFEIPVAVGGPGADHEPRAVL